MVVQTTRARYTGSRIGTWRSLVAHPAGGRKVAGSNPAVPTLKALQMRGFSFSWPSISGDMFHECSTRAANHPSTKAARRPTASRWRPGKTCAYTVKVKTTDAWPNRSLTILGCSLFAKSNVREYGKDYGDYETQIFFLCSYWFTCRLKLNFYTENGH